VVVPTGAAIFYARPRSDCQINCIDNSSKAQTMMRKNSFSECHCHGARKGDLVQLQWQHIDLIGHRTRMAYETCEAGNRAPEKAARPARRLRRGITGTAQHQRQRKDTANHTQNQRHHRLGHQIDGQITDQNAQRHDNHHDLQHIPTEMPPVSHQAKHV